MTAPSTLRDQVIAAGAGWCAFSHSHDNSKAAIAAATTALLAAKERLKANVAGKLSRVVGTPGTAYWGAYLEGAQDASQQIDALLRELENGQ